MSWNCELWPRLLIRKTQAERRKGTQMTEGLSASCAPCLQATKPGREVISEESSELNHSCHLCQNTHRHTDTHGHGANKRVGRQNDSLEKRIGKKFRNQPPMAPCGNGAAYGVCVCACLCACLWNALCMSLNRRVFQK